MSWAVDYVDCFASQKQSEIPSSIPSRPDHPAPRLGIQSQNEPVPTNRFYANLFLGNQNQGVWTHPYSLTWSRGSGNLRSWGMSISHIDADQRAYGPPNPNIPGSPVQYFINPIGIQSIILSAIELSESTTLNTDSLQPMSVNARLSSRVGSPNWIVFPLVQGMGFVTAQYRSLMPVIQSGVLFRTVLPLGQIHSGIFKYKAVLEDGKAWLVFARPDDSLDPRFSLVSNSQLQGVRDWSGLIQVCKVPQQSDEAVLDATAGCFTTGAVVTASVRGHIGNYGVKWDIQRAHQNQKALMFALPHHVQSFDSLTGGSLTSIKLQTTTKGVVMAVLADEWNMVEADLPVSIGFNPWTPNSSSNISFSDSTFRAIKDVAQSELAQDFEAQTDLDSMYFSGKALSKLATIVYAVNCILNEPEIAAQALQRLKHAFARFVSNRQKCPLVYDSAWRGIVSSASYDGGDPGQDFGNTYFNDHHFHYAAIIACLDPSWLPENAPWVNALVRDVANPSTTDVQFPFSRMFDWYHGHSFAKGLFESADSKDEESTSEDAMFAYALKMWGKASGNRNLEAQGSMMLAILRRTLDNYFLMRSENVHQPSNFIGNKVTGILFENKIDHTTYFGANPEYIQGIHMLPLLPFTPYTRCPSFIAEEWNAYFSPTSSTPASTVAGGWRGVLYGNLACIDPQKAWDFFAQEHFDGSWIDGGASRTWYMITCAVLGGL